jgi:hypothetical protein
VPEEPAVPELPPEEEAPAPAAPPLSSSSSLFSTVQAVAIRDSPSPTKQRVFKACIVFDLSLATSGVFSMPGTYPSTFCKSVARED